MNASRNFYTAPINFNTAGDHTIVNSSATSQILIWQIGFAVDATTTITIKHGGSSFSGAYPMAAYSPFEWDYVGAPHYVCLPGEAFIINQAGTANVGGMVWYTLG